MFLYIYSVGPHIQNSDCQANCCGALLCCHEVQLLFHTSNTGELAAMFATRVGSFDPQSIWCDLNAPFLSVIVLRAREIYEMTRGCSIDAKDMLEGH